MNNLFKLISICILFISSSLADELVVNYKDTLKVDKGALNFKLELSYPGFLKRVGLNYTQSNEFTSVGHGFKLKDDNEISLCKLKLNKTEDDDEKRNFDLQDANNYCFNGTKIFRVSNNIYRLKILTQ